MEDLKQNKVWSEQETAEFYETLLQKALDNIPETGAVMVLGPMFILRPAEENFALFELAQNKLSSEGKVVFNQLPYTDYKLQDAPFDYKIKFEIFYKKLIQSGKIIECYLLPEWEKSEGTRSEVEYCKEFGVPVIEI